MKAKLAVIIVISAILFFASYIPDLTNFSHPEPLPKKELLIFCGITMIQPMTEIASIFESRYDVKISLIKGGSGNLLKSIKYNNLGDLYLPGSESYIKQAKLEGLVTESVHVGNNRASLMLQKGNPRKINPDLNALKDKNYYVVIGNPESGSIGKETKKILSAAGIYDEVMNNAQELTTDSKRLIEVLKNNEADLVINWYATSTWVENRDFVETLPINEKFSKKKNLLLGLLKTTKYPEIARQIMTYSTSNKGREIFQKYGLYDIN